MCGWVGVPTVIPMRGAACRAWYDRTSWIPMWSVCHWCTLPACWRSAPRWTCAMTLTQFAACGARYGAFGRTSLCVAHARHFQGIHLLRHLVSSANFDVSLLDGGQGESEFLPAPPFSVAKVVHAANHAIAHDPAAAAELFGTIARLLGDIASHPGQAIGRTVRKNALPLVQVGLCWCDVLCLGTHRTILLGRCSCHNRTLSFNMQALCKRAACLRSPLPRSDSAASRASLARNRCVSSCARWPQRRPS